MVEVLKAHLLGGYPLRHGFSTRHGGVSTGHLTSLNMAFNQGDREENVLMNRDRFFSALGSSAQAGVFCQQIHSKQVVKVEHRHAGSGAKDYESGIADCDGLVTSTVNLPLGIFTADCVAVLFYDPVRHVAGACHAGWPGSAAGIVDEVVGCLAARYGTRVQDILVAMGPAASGCCYEVDDRVQSKLADGVSLGYVRNLTPGKYMVDLRQYNSLRLVRLGVLPENIELVGGCTICGEEYFSHRRQKGKTGRMLGVIELLPC